MNSDRYEKISQALQDIINKSKQNQYETLQKQWKDSIESSGKLIEKIIADNNYIDTNSDEIEKEINQLNNKLDAYTELGIDLEGELASSYKFLEIRRNLEKNYRILSSRFYKYNFDKMREQYGQSKKLLEQISEKNKKLENNMEEVSKKINNVDNRIENLGSTFLNIVLTISVTSTMITLLSKSAPKYSFAIIIGCSWLLLTSIIFISYLFISDENVKKKNNFAKVVYIILSVVTLAAFTFAYFSDGNITIRIGNNDNNQKISTQRENVDNETNDQNNNLELVK